MNDSTGRVYGVKGGLLADSLRADDPRDYRNVDTERDQ